MVFAFLSLSEYAIIKQHVNDIWQRKAVSQVHFRKNLPDQERASFIINPDKHLSKILLIPCICSALRIYRNSSLLRREIS